MANLEVPGKDRLSKEEQDAIKRVPNVSYIAEIRIIQTEHPDIFTLIFVDEQSKDSYRGATHRNVIEQFIIDAKANGVEVKEEPPK